MIDPYRPPPTQGMVQIRVDGELFAGDDVLDLSHNMRRRGLVARVVGGQLTITFPDDLLHVVSDPTRNP